MAVDFLGFQLEIRQYKHEISDETLLSSTANHRIYIKAVVIALQTTEHAGMQSIVDVQNVWLNNREFEVKR